MSDMGIDIASLVGDDEDLMFGDAAIAAPAPAASSKPAAPKKASRAPKKASKIAAPKAEVSAPTPSAAPIPAAAAKPAVRPEPLPRLEDATAGSSVSPPLAPAAPMPAPAAPAKERPSVWLCALVGLSMVTSFASLGGLVAVGRSLATLNAERARNAEQTEAIARIGPLVHRLDEASARLSAAAARAPAAGAPPATSEDLRRGLDDFRLALSHAQPAGAGALGATVQGGFVQLDERLARIERALDAQRPRIVVTPVRATH